MPAPALSVCIPVYNGARTIERCLDSLIGQPDHDPTRVEIVVVDDCSKDETRELIDRFRGQGVRIEHNEVNLGLTGNWERALSLGRGDVVTLLHMDDWHAIGCGAAASALFQAEPRLVLAAFGQVHVRDDGSVHERNLDRDIGVFGSGEYLERRLQFHDCPAPSMAFFRRTALEAVTPLYDAAFRWCPELDLYLRLAVAHTDGLFAHDERVLIRRGAGKGQFSYRYPGYNIIDTCTALERHLHRVTDPSTRARCLTAARRAIATDLASVLLLRDVRQLGEVLRAPSFLRWIRSSAWNAPAVAALLGARGARKLGRMLAGEGRP